MYDSVFFLAADNKEYELKIDHEDIQVFYGKTLKGSISFRLIEQWGGSNDHYYITNLDLEKCKRLGIGRACLKAHIDFFGAPICAASLSGPKMDDGSHLVNDGGAFIEKMRQEGLVRAEV